MIKSRKKSREINETESWIFEKIYKIEKPLATLTKKKERRHKLQTSGMKQKMSLPTPQTSKE